jgi:GH35 family endo-1,4-beta-xylanase
MSLFTTAFLATLAITASASPMKRWPNPLRSDAVKAGKAYFGVAYQSFYLADPRFEPILDEEFGQYTPENEMKWEVIEPSRGVFNYSGADLVSNHTRQVDLVLIYLRSLHNRRRPTPSSEVTTSFGINKRESIAVQGYISLMSAAPHT